jgi:hypothetical protein
MVVKQRQILPYQENITTALFCLRYDEQLGRITSIGRSLGGSCRHVHLRSSLDSLFTQRLLLVPIIISMKGVSRFQSFIFFFSEAVSNENPSCAWNVLLVCLLSVIGGGNIFKVDPILNSSFEF